MEMGTLLVQLRLLGVGVIVPVILYKMNIRSYVATLLVAAALAYYSLQFVIEDH